MVQDPCLKTVFPEPPINAYTRPQSIRDKLIRAKVPPESSRPKRIIQGMHQCRKNSDICPYVKTGKVIKAKHSKEVIQISNYLTVKLQIQSTSLIARYVVINMSAKQKINWKKGSNSTLVILPKTPRQLANTLTSKPIIVLT